MEKLAAGMGREGARLWAGAAIRGGQAETYNGGDAVGGETVDGESVVGGRSEFPPNHRFTDSLSHR